MRSTPLGGLLSRPHLPTALPSPALVALAWLQSLAMRQSPPSELGAHCPSGPRAPGCHQRSALHTRSRCWLPVRPELCCFHESEWSPAQHCVCPVHATHPISHGSRCGCASLVSLIPCDSQVPTSRLQNWSLSKSLQSPVQGLSLPSSDADAAVTFPRSVLGRSPGPACLANTVPRRGCLAPTQPF